MQAVNDVLDHTVVRMEDPGFYLNSPELVYQRLHNEAPVFWYEPVGFWVISKYADIRNLAKSDKFTSRDGIFLNDIKFGGISTEFLDNQQLSYMDPPHHTALRKLFQPTFNLKSFARLEQRIREKACELLDAIPSGEVIDFVEAVSVPLPMTIIAEFLGLRKYDIRQLQYWSDAFMKAGFPLSEEELIKNTAAVKEMTAFFEKELEAQRTDPQEGLIADMLEMMSEQGPLTENVAITTLQGLLIAGNETTRSTLSGQLSLLIRHPDQLQRLRDNPGLCRTAVDESVRYFAPTQGFFRRAREDVELRGQTIKKGDYIYLFFGAGNRDAEIIANPNDYDVGRNNNPPHQGFGSGTHFCLGAPLARLEIRILFEELLSRFSHFELAGEPERLLSILNSGYISLPVKMIRSGN